MKLRDIPNFKRNLKSLGEHEKNEYVFKGEKRVVKVLKG